MAITDTGTRFAPLAEELLENRYARENLREGTEKLRAAIAAFDEGSAALLSGRRRPRRKGRKLVVGVLALGAAGAGAALALSEELRDSVVGSARAIGEEILAPGEEINAPDA